MDALFEVLLTSTDNEARKAAAVQLRQVQAAQPDMFLQHTYDQIAVATLRPERRFFLCTLVLAFVGESWHNGVSKESQERFLRLYLQLTATQAFPSVLLARKVALIVATMARRVSRKAQVGALPPLICDVVSCYVTELHAATAAAAYDRVCCFLLYTHVLLKELQGSRTGHVFEDVCAALVAPLSSVFALLPDAATMLTRYEVALYLLKCSLRVFGRGVFDPAFHHFLLDATWRLAAGLGRQGDAPTTAEQRQRLLEYALKIEEATAVYFPSQLENLGGAFFVDADGEATSATSSAGASGAAAAVGAAPAHSLFALLAAVVRSPVETVVSEKAVCRALRLFTALLSAEDGDAFVQHCLRCFATSAAFPPFLQHLVATYLADEATPERLQEWTSAPERVAAELDVDMDDDASMMGGAEQLFLAFTGSSECAAASLAAAWAVVNALLQDGQVGPVTAALHAIGIGYYTMASADDPTAYLTFLHGRLLPLLDPAALARLSPFIARRVVWLVGMWCESVPAPADRRAVLTALEAVLQHAATTHNVVLLLVTLKSVENFVSDNQFSLQDLPPPLVTTVLTAVAVLLTKVRSPSSVKELAGLVHVLIEKGAVLEQGEQLVHLFAPPVQAIAQLYEMQAQQLRDRGPSMGLPGSDDEDDAEDGSLATLSILLDCLGSSVRQCRDDATIWSLMPTVVQPCIYPSGAAAAWAEDNAWELFLTMAQSSHAFDAAAAAAALSTALQHTQRDFAMLPLVFRTVYALLLLRAQPVEDAVAAPQLEAWVAVLRDSPSAELCNAVSATLMAVARLSGGPLRAALCHHAVQLLAAAPEVQAESWAVSVAMVLALGVSAASTAAEQAALLAQVHADTAAAGATFSTLLEQLVLLLDVSPSMLVSRALGHLLEALCRSAPAAVSAEDQGMVQRAWDGVEDDGEARTAEEMLLEWLDDADVPLRSPHVPRVMAAFAVLLA